MNTTIGTTETPVEVLRGILEATEEVDSLDRLNYRLSDAIREGSSVTKQKIGGWGDSENACALHAGVIAARARGIME